MTETIKPGMERAIEAGTTLTIQASDGGEIAVTGRESQKTMDFLQAFDEYQDAFREGVQGQQLAFLWQKAMRSFNALPMRVLMELGSFKRLGIQR